MTLYRMYVSFWYIVYSCACLLVKLPPDFYLQCVNLPALFFPLLSGMAIVDIIFPVLFRKPADASSPPRTTALLLIRQVYLRAGQSCSSMPMMAPMKDLCTKTSLSLAYNSILRQWVDRKIWKVSSTSSSILCAKQRNLPESESCWMEGSEGT